MVEGSAIATDAMDAAATAAMTEDGLVCEVKGVDGEGGAEQEEVEGGCAVVEASGAQDDALDGDVKQLEESEAGAAVVEATDSGSTDAESSAPASSEVIVSAARHDDGVSASADAELERADADSLQTHADTTEGETPEQAATRKKAAKNKAKRERQKAKVKAALQQVRAAEAAGVAVGQDATMSQAEMQAQFQAQLEAQMQAQMAQMQAQLQAQMEARMQSHMLPQSAPAVGATVDAAASTAGQSSTSAVARTEQLMRRVEMLQAANRNEVATKQQLGQQPRERPQPKQAQKPVEKRLEDMRGEELAQALHKRAALFATNDKWEEANTAWGQATEVTPDNGEMWYYRGIASQKLERTLDAEKYWKRAVKLGHKQSASLLSGVRSKRAQEARAKADALLQADKFDKAIGMYTAAMNICPDNADHCAACHNGRATAFGLTAQWEDAKAEWASASKLAPSNPAFFHYQGLATLKLEQFDEAEGFLAKAVDMGHEKSQEQLDTCQRLQRERMAVILYQRAMTLWEDVDKAGSSDSGNGSARKSKAKNGAKSTKLCKAALAEFREADKAGYHNKPAIHIMSALCLTKLQRWGEAVREIKQALATIPAEVAAGAGEDHVATKEWSFQGLDRARLVGMAVNLEKMHQAQQKSEAHTLLQARTS